MMISIATTQPDAATTLDADRCRLEQACEHAAGRMFEAELALHDAHASHVDAWNTPAYDKLHAAIQAHAAAREALRWSLGSPVVRDGRRHGLVSA